MEFRVPRCIFLTAVLAKFKKNNHTPGVMRNHYLIRARYVKLSKVSAINHLTVTVKLVQQQFYMTGYTLQLLHFLQVFSASTTNGAGGAMLPLCFKLIFTIASALSNPRSEKHQCQAIPTKCISMEDLTDQGGLIDQYGHKASQGVTTSLNLLPPWGPPSIYRAAAASHTVTAMSPDPASTSLTASSVLLPPADFSLLNWFNANFNQSYWDTNLLAMQMLIPQNKGKSQFTSANPTGALGPAWCDISLQAHSTCTTHCPSDLKKSPREDRPAQHNHQQWDAGKHSSAWGCYRDRGCSAL